MNRFIAAPAMVLALAGAAMAAPEIDQAVLVPGAGHCQNGSLQMELTIGEPTGLTANGTLEGRFGYWWKILVVNVDVEPTTVPVAYSLKRPVPNPFITTTAIMYAIPKSGRVALKIYDVTGRLVRMLVDADQPAGEYRQVWDGTGDDGTQAHRGVFFANLKAGGFEDSRKIVLIR